MTKKLWPLETDFGDLDAPHKMVSCARCATHVFVANDDPRLPDGPFFCPDHSDAPPNTKKASDHTEASLTCDRCGARLVTQGSTHEDAIAKLWALADEHRWESTFNGGSKDCCPACVTH